MISGRKAFHFDLDEDKLKVLYPSESKTGYKTAWGKIQTFMESYDFEHTQYSGYESIHGMDYATAYTVLDSLQEKFPWFKDCAEVATLTEIGKRHDVLEHFKQVMATNGPDADASHEEVVSLRDEVMSTQRASEELGATKDGMESPMKGESGKER